jgi:hypothetical protein
MYEFVADQVFGLNGLVNFSNIVFLAAYSVRNVLTLRILAIVGEGMILPYYYYQDDKLWPPIYWGVAFMIVNAIRIVGMALERRPVVFSDKEEELYRVAFDSIDKRVAVLGNKTRMALRPGQLIGDVSAYSGLASPVDVVACGRAVLAKWDLQQQREFMASRPELRANLLRIVSADLAAKLREATTVVSGFRGEKFVPEPAHRGE